MSRVLERFAAAGWPLHANDKRDHKGNAFFLPLFSSEDEENETAKIKRLNFCAVGKKKMSSAVACYGPRYLPFLVVLPDSWEECYSLLHFLQNVFWIIYNLVQHLRVQIAHEDLNALFRHAMKYPVIKLCKFNYSNAVIKVI